MSGNVAVVCSLCGMGAWRPESEVGTMCTRPNCVGHWLRGASVAEKTRAEISAFEALAKALEPLDRDQARRVVLAIGELRGLDSLGPLDT